LLDSIFSAGLRKGVPASVVGEAIMYLSRQHDLGDLAEPDDKMTIIYGDKPRPGGQSPGRVLYVGVVHQGKTIRCFVYKPDAGNDFKCLDENDITAEIEVSNGIVIPVAGGVLTSGFGPRKHPILKTVLLHKGVDWAAPIGTPVLAAMNGTISFAGDGGSYGNLIKIAHEGGRESRYAHLNAFAKTALPGSAVTAGDVIGYIGTTGRSTGPHLHFELYLAGQPIDPLVTATSVVVAAGGDEGAVEKLVNRIIHVESGGSATAKNPLSTATGLGQFIESTWLRMMRTYRADLANSLSREKLLALRFDPTLSREMVTNLARENKAYLVAGGVQITAGRLYLAHFLGPEGARVALSASDSSDLEQLLGSGVINANPFLRGKDVLFIKNWAEKKMQGKAYVPQVAKAEVKKESVQKTSPAYALYRKAMVDIAG
jgi:murein DD-endopeptidase MepM/ murein hydrolase activator NlpD